MNEFDHWIISSKILLTIQSGQKKALSSAVGSKFWVIYVESLRHKGLRTFLSENFPRIQVRRIQVASGFLESLSGFSNISTSLINGWIYLDLYQKWCVALRFGLRRYSPKIHAIISNETRIPSPMA